ncbi:MBL fold metallo-hydrolase [Planococcus liqunii]|uniref:MBL fold metallo-hydrolase n=1 Tax=Planococcus liqunii TaxID=3058394 RepID=UPI002635CC70|nr:MBL fold metallo-hydrolase [Planococcus sp. N056]WKA50196.1 MBL fold metallo-hydrolase [Planococcus sp. N056]
MKIFQSCLWQTNTTLIEGKEECFLFDPTYYPHELEHIKGALPDKPLNLIYTHADWDHIAGFSAFSYGHTIGHQQVKEQNDQLEKARSFDLEWYVARNKELNFPRIDEEIVGETTKVVSDDTLYFLPIPGHTSDMMATFFVERKVVVAGDILSDLEFPFIFHSSRKYVKSLQKMKEKIMEHAIHTLIPGHGRPILNSQPEILQRIEDDLAYLHQIMSGNQFATYRQQPIPPHLIPRHEGNIEFVEAELNK